ncbi:MAG: glucose-1-phosphate adenylyltransferase, partial [Thermoplasmata archaeon]|nr:glucose-1-phosphate adenylyltransferase [Thermoplasmata archaeon]
DGVKYYANMGVYLFDTDLLIESLVSDDALNEMSRHDFGRDIIPAVIEKAPVYAYDFQKLNLITDTEGAVIADAFFWRDIGTIKAYFDANMELKEIVPKFNLYDEVWPIRTYHPELPPAKFIFDFNGRRGQAIDSIVSQGSIISGAEVTNSILSPGVRIEGPSLVTNCVIFDNVRIGRNVKLRNCIIDTNVQIPENTELGFDRENDIRKLGLELSEQNGTLVNRETNVVMSPDGIIVVPGLPQGAFVLDVH